MSGRQSRQMSARIAKHRGVDAFGAFGEAGGAVLLGLLADERGGQLCVPGQRGHHRDAAHLHGLSGGAPGGGHAAGHAQQTIVSSQQVQLPLDGTPAAVRVKAGQPVRLVFDTDITGDVDESYLNAVEGRRSGSGSSNLIDCNSDGGRYRECSIGPGYFGRLVRDASAMTDRSWVIQISAVPRSRQSFCTSARIWPWMVTRPRRSSASTALAWPFSTPSTR